MKKLLVICVCLSSLAFAEERKSDKSLSAFVELEVEARDEEASPTIKGAFSPTFAKNFGMSIFFLGTPNYFEVYGGLAFIIPDHFRLEISLGAEQQGKHGFGWRFAALTWINYKFVSFRGTVEWNMASFVGNYAGTWYDLDLLFKVNDIVSLGIKDRRPLGIGPQLRIDVPRVCEFWLAWAPLPAERIAFEWASFGAGIRKEF